MSILCGTSSQCGGALEAAEAIARHTSLGPVITVDLDHAGDPVDAVLRGARERDVQLIVLATGRRCDAVATQIAHAANVPLLLVRDPRPLVDWATSQRPLRVVLGWDDSTTTLAALEPILALRRAAPVHLDVVHVYFPDEMARRYGTRVASMVDPSPELEALLRRDIAHELGTVAGQGAVRVVPVLGIGHVGEHLLDYVASTGADLLVGGTHHRHGLRRLSSVAERMLRDGSASVLMVPRPRNLHLEVAPPLQVAVVATDGSTFANQAVSYAYRLVPDSGEVHLVRVVADGERVDDPTLLDDLMTLRPSEHATRTVPHIIRDRDPAHAIAVAAEQVGADVVCIASHARTGIARAVIGSVTDRLLHVCRRPVLVVHPVE